MVMHLRRDEGFSLTELLVVLILMGVLLAASYGGLQATFKGREVSDRQAYFSREVGTPLSVCEKILTQAISIEDPGDYTVTVLTDRDNDNIVERHRFIADSSGRLTEDIWLTDQYRVNTTRLDLNTWSEHNVNVARGQPMFNFYDENDQQISDMLLVSSEARYVDVIITVDYEGHEYTDVRTITFRNR